MASQHRFPARTFRPEPGEYADAQADLAARGKEMDAFLRACLHWLHRNPDQFLATLTPVWPGPRPRGRPPGSSATPQMGPASHQPGPKAASTPRQVPGAQTQAAEAP